jgi:hypothetical protein
MDKLGNSESDIVNVAIKQLPAKIRERLEKLFEEGLLKDNDLDLRSVTVFASLNEGLQDRVMTHMENERIYVANARSKSGFLIATCDKAKTGCLDARGLGAIDPWRSALVAMATPKQKLFELEPERDWLDKHDHGPVKLHVNVACVENELGMRKVTVEMPLSETSAALKSKLANMGVESVPANRMKLHVEPVGFLKDRLSLAYYNLVDGNEIELVVGARGGARYRKDHAVPKKRPKTQDRQHVASNPAEHLRIQKNGGPAAFKAMAEPKLAAVGTAPTSLPGLAGGLPGMPGLPTLPGGFPGLAGAAPKLGGLPGLGAGFPGLPKVGGFPGLGGTMPGLAGGLAGGPLGGLPGLAGLGGAMPGLAMPGLAKGGAPGLPGLAGLAGLAGGLPGGLAGLAGLAKAKSPGLGF